MLEAVSDVLNDRLVNFFRFRADFGAITHEKNVLMN